MADKSPPPGGGSYIRDSEDGEWRLNIEQPEPAGAPAKAPEEPAEPAPASAPSKTAATKEPR